MVYKYNFGAYETCAVEEGNVSLQTWKERRPE